MQSAGEAAVGTSGSVREHPLVHGGGSEPVLTPFAGAVPAAGHGCGSALCYDEARGGLFCTKTSQMNCSIADPVLRNLSWVLLFSCKLQLGFILQKQKTTPLPPPTMMRCPLAQGIPAMGNPGLADPGGGGLLPSRGFRDPKCGTHCTEKHPKIKPTSTHRYPPPSWWEPLSHTPTALINKLHPAKSFENEHRHQARSLLFWGVSSTVANHEGFVVITE